MLFFLYFHRFFVVMTSFSLISAKTYELLVSGNSALLASLLMVLLLAFLLLQSFLLMLIACITPVCWHSFCWSPMCCWRSRRCFCHCCCWHSIVNGRTNFKLVLPYSSRKVKNENLKGEFARSQRSSRSSLFSKFSVYKRIVYLRQYTYKYMY